MGRDFGMIWELTSYKKIFRAPSSLFDTIHSWRGHWKIATGLR